MSQELFQRLEQLFFELEKASDEERARRLSQLHEEDPTLAEHLEQLLLAHPTEILPSDASSASSGDRDVLDPAPLPSELEQGSPSRFKLIGLIGEGGMGSVHEAEQLSPVNRRVAIKLIRGATASRRAIARFEAERQTLATLNHPNIARVFEAGADQEGRLFFAMELVKGVPINEYCDRHRLSTRKRIELFRQVCDGVSHAHRNGIIHRDLKPSNILVEESEGQPNAKIIDFGIAKVISPWNEPDPGVKRSALPVGTPEYMSPEQFQEGAIDTRSDVYALGVLLFELLVGELPISGGELRRRSIEEMRRQVRDLPTPTPSSRVATTTEQAQLAAQLRDTAPAALVRQLRGELDWIVLKALAKEPAERYDSVPELAADLRSFLEHEPVSVGPRNWSYRARKWVRRHRLAAGVAALVASAIVLGVVGLAVGLQQARNAEAKAEQEATVRGEVIDFLRSLLSSGAKSLEQGEEVTVRDLFTRAQRQLRDDPPQDPFVLGTLLNRIGDFHHMDLQDYATATELYQEAEAVLRNADPHGAELSSSLFMRGINERLRGRLDVARPLLEEALALRERAFGADSVATAAILGELAIVSRLERDFPTALELMERAVAISTAATGAHSDETLAEKLNLAGTYNQAGRVEESLAINQDVLAVARERDLPLYESVAVNNLGQLAARRGDLAAAADYIDQAIAIQRDRLDSDPTRLEVTLSNSAMIRAKRGDYAVAAERMREALPLAQVSTGEKGASAATLHVLLGEIESRAGNYHLARPGLETALDIYRGVSPENPAISPLRARRLLALIDEAEGNRQTARDRLNRALQADRQGEHDYDPEGACMIRLELVRFLSATAAQQAMQQASTHCTDTGVWETPRVLYARTAAHASLGETEQALDRFEALSQTGFADAWPARDPALEALRGEQRFQDLSAKVVPD